MREGQIRIDIYEGRQEANINYRGKVELQIRKEEVNNNGIRNENIKVVFQ